MNNSLDNEKPAKVKASDSDIYTVTTIIAFLFSPVGIILGVLYLSKKDKIDHKLGEHLIAVGLLSAIMFGVVWFNFSPFRILTPVTTINNLPTTVTPTTTTTTWDVNTEYAKIAKGMSKSSVDTAINKTGHCTTAEQSINTDKYSSCTYGELGSGEGLIIVNYINDVVTTTEKVSSTN